MKESSKGFSWYAKTAIRAGLFNSLLRSEKSPERRIKEAARTPLFFGPIDNIRSFLGFSGRAMRMFNGKYIIHVL
ncbi:hypothetical protein SAMN05421747_1279 [Parapedobacter composti]|uniref:Uncharacterized protein n=1 Tax=Parapedobacter composti TaxID=623281 RepID=A0A1I1M127_9SPHI|nr:hypothetical protein SAMN05421747_1279 [Parapedobacter composti]